jgi:L-methionine (R)-S-oxide reductase
MAETLILPEKGTREEKYKALLPQLEALLAGEEDEIANMANLSAGLKGAFGWLWVGFYLAKDDQLVLGPFQGPIACTRISYGKGVCGKAWKEGKTLIVPDVDQFPGHIACSSSSRSEIVVPLKDQSGKVFGVLDIDSSELGTYDKIDQKYLEQLVRVIAQRAKRRA